MQIPATGKRASTAARKVEDEARAKAVLNGRRQGFMPGTARPLRSAHHDSAVKPSKSRKRRGTT